MINSAQTGKTTVGTWAIWAVAILWPAAAAGQTFADPHITLGVDVSILSTNQYGSGHVTSSVSPRFTVALSHRTMVGMRGEFQVRSNVAGTRSVVATVEFSHAIVQLSRGDVFIAIDAGVRAHTRTEPAFPPLRPNATTAHQRVPVFLAGGGVNVALGRGTAVHTEAQLLLGGNQHYGYLFGPRVAVGLIVKLR